MSKIAQQQQAILIALENRPDGVQFRYLSAELLVPKEIFTNDQDYNDAVSALAASNLCRIVKGRVHLTVEGKEAATIATRADGN